MLYSHLLKHQYRRAMRSVRRRYRWVTAAALFVFGVYVAFVLLSSGFLLRELLLEAGIQVNEVGFVNEHLLVILLGLLVLRFFTQSTPALLARPYLHLPIDRARLVRFFQLSGLLSLHNVFPLLFFLPFWGRYLIWERQDVTLLPAAFAWLGQIVLVLLFSQYLTVLFRTLLSSGRWGFLVVLIAVGLLTLSDLLVGGATLQSLSSRLFDAPLRGEWGSSILLLLLVVLCFGVSSRLIQGQLRSATPPSIAPARHLALPAFNRLPGVVPNLLLLELRLIMRHHRPRFYTIFAFVFGALYAAILLMQDNLLGSQVAGALACLFASGAFILNYGQLMFSWESSYFDGFLARHRDLKSIVLAKLILLQLSSLALFVLTLPLFGLIAPDQLDTHVAFLLYNAGVTSVWVMALAVRNRERIDLRNGNGFLNYEGLSAAHWLWFVFTMLPPVIFVLILRDYPAIAIFVLGATGAISILFTGPWSTFFTRQLVYNRHAMAAGFRDHDR